MISYLSLQMLKNGLLTLCNFTLPDDIVSYMSILHCSTILLELLYKATYLDLGQCFTVGNPQHGQQKASEQMDYKPFLFESFKTSEFDKFNILYRHMEFFLN